MDPSLSSYDDMSGVRDAVMSALERRGATRSIKAKIRAEVHASLNNDALPPPKVPNDLYLCGELIKDFLLKIKCDSTLSVFNEEIGISGSLQRDILGKELGLDVSTADSDVPLLLLLMQSMQSRAVSAQGEHD